MTYDELLIELKACAENSFAEFQKRLIPTKQEILGVRTPKLRLIAKKYRKEIKELMDFPDTYYEVTFIKLTVISLADYATFLKYVDACVSLIDNWATCDCFRAKCLNENKAEFLPCLERLFSNGGEFFERYALVTLLGYYVEEKYLPLIKGYIEKADTSQYYVYMAVAWLVAEILIKYPDYGKEILRLRVLDTRTHNKAIQKARESYRVNIEEKEYLNSLKIKKGK